jgi:hypothetical protein
LQCKVDILRARNIVPLHDNTASKNSETKAAEIPTPIETIAAKDVETPQEKPEIPSFDLAEEIMAEQRRITAIRRKAPGQRTEAQQNEPVDHPPTPALSEQEKIIAEIVARDIERLCRGIIPTNSI